MTIPEVVLFSGKMGTGKNHIAAEMRREAEARGQKCIELAFATTLKAMICGKGIDPGELLSGTKTAQTRQLLTQTGQDCRSENGPEFFAKTLHFLICHFFEQGYTTFFITDLRLQVEFWYFLGLDTRDIFNTTFYRITAPKRNRARLLAEAKGDEEVADKLAANISEVDLDEISQSHPSFIQLYNDHNV